MIRLVLPISFVDRQLGEKLIVRMNQLGDLKEHSALIAVCWADSWDIGPFREAAEQTFKSVDLLVMPDVPEAAGWPEAPNHMFYHCAQHLHNSGNTNPWYFFEMDNFPVRAGWLGEFEREYNERGMPYLGYINATRFRNRQTEQLEVRGRHMVGTGIYPADFFTRCRSVHFLDHLPFDVAIEEEVVPECHPTNLIFHAWKTSAYHLVDGQLIGKDHKHTEGRHRYGGRPVPKGAAVIHGCKDDSLYRVDFRAQDATVQSNG